MGISFSFFKFPPPEYTCVSVFYSPGSISDGNPIVYWFNMISDQLIYDVSEAVLIHLFMVKTFFKRLFYK